MSNENTIEVKLADGTVKIRRKPVAFEAFMDAVEASNSVQEVHEKTGLTIGSIEARMAKYRHEGIPMKSFAGGKGAPRLDVSKAQAYLAKLRGVDVSEIKAAGDKLLAKVAERKAAKETEATATEATAEVASS